MMTRDDLPSSWDRQPYDTRWVGHVAAIDMTRDGWHYDTVLILAAHTTGYDVLSSTGQVWNDVTVHDLMMGEMK